MLYKKLLDTISRYIIYTNINSNVATARHLANALGRSYCTKEKIVVVLNSNFFSEVIFELMQIGKLLRSNMYIIFIGNKVKLKSARSIAYGMGFTVFDYNKTHSNEELLNSIQSIIDKIIGPVCIFIDKDSM